MIVMNYNYSLCVLACCSLGFLFLFVSDKYAQVCLGFCRFVRKEGHCGRKRRRRRRFHKREDKRDDKKGTKRKEKQNIKYKLTERGGGGQN